MRDYTFYYFFFFSIQISDDPTSSMLWPKATKLVKGSLVNIFKSVFNY